ncbi:MAG: CoA-disulfide reductase [Candidatus Nanopelagicaceae bacterium]|nr:CoA-disulfide reductase [Candidatus Nanopelagicaceae bacterium]
MKRFVIIGGVAGGMSAATRLRRLDESAEIVVLEKSGFVSYANCGLPYYIGGVISKEQDLLLQTPESLNKRFNLDVRVNSEVTAIDSAAKSVSVRNSSTGEIYSLVYNKLILSPGATPIVPPIEGVDRAMTLRTVEDTKKIFTAVESKPATAVVIGGGFIGVEVAENLVHRGIKTTLVEASAQVLAPLDPEMALLVSNEMSKHGVNLYLNSSATKINPNSVVLSSGEEVPADLVILAIGVRPDISLAKDAGLQIGTRGGVVVDENNLTSDPDIYALGDAAEKTDALDESSTLVPLANIANRHGRVIADHINGRNVRPVKTIGTAIVKVFDLAVASTGWNEKRLKAANIEHRAIHTHPGSHAGYYPGAETLALKLLINPKTGEIYGAQGVGKDGVDKRIDVISTAIRAGITAPELADLELAYAPPFGSAKDPVNMLGYVAENIVSGLVKTAQWHEIEDFRNDEFTLLDVRTPGECAKGMIPGFINIPVDEIRNRFSEIKTKKVLVTCQVGQRAHTATLLLKNLGFEPINLDGGFHLWSNSPAANKEKVQA